MCPNKVLTVGITSSLCAACEPVIFVVNRWALSQHQLKKWLKENLDGGEREKKKNAVMDNLNSMV